MDGGQPSLLCPYLLNIDINGGNTLPWCCTTVLWQSFAPVQLKHQSLISAGSGANSSPNLESSYQICVQLHVSNPVITGPSVPGKTIIGSSCLFVLSFSSSSLHHDQSDIARCMIRPTTWAFSPLLLLQDLVQITFVQNHETHQESRIDNLDSRTPWFHWVQWRAESDMRPSCEGK